MNDGEGGFWDGVKWWLQGAPFLLGGLTAAGLVIGGFLVVLAICSVLCVRAFNG